MAVRSSGSVNCLVVVEVLPCCCGCVPLLLWLCYAVVLVGVVCRVDCVVLIG